jgi:hypothetical protein
MKARYKLGMFIKTKETDDTESEVGIIDAIVIRKDGVFYTLTDSNRSEVAEEEIGSVYKEWKPRASKESPKRARKPKAVAA